MIDKAGKLRQMTINDLPVGRDVDETLRLVQVTTQSFLIPGILTVVQNENGAEDCLSGFPVH